MSTYEKILQSDDSSSEEREMMTDEDQRMNLVHDNLTMIPKRLLHSYAPFMRILDISNNYFSDVSFLTEFKSLRTLIMDHNRIDENAIFPTVATLNVLWLNHNKVGVLFPFVKNLQKSLPALKELSLMGNKGVPPDIDDTTFYTHLQYRLFTISFFANLTHLDGRKVKADEREEAVRLYKRPLLERLADHSSIAHALAGTSFDLLVSLSLTPSQALNRLRNRRRSSFI